MKYFRKDILKVQVVGSLYKLILKIQSMGLEMVHLGQDWFQWLFYINMVKHRLYSTMNSV